ncbi:hypothetical protein V8F06_004058 [Rhypophila decipiens]
MARLNEPPVAPDSLEILRRRFLRQNRDIAKINSVQSLKIRGLENECARLLSENLDLKGQVIRLEKEVEQNSAQRIADHALEIKAKMEAQLQEWGAMLAGLGVEPPAKRRSLEKRKSPKPRLSGSRSPPQRRRRNTGAGLDALAAQEGRLPPIYEHKSYPRATMNTEEILALFSEAVDSSSNSPDLGPPPVSRYVDGDPVKMDSPSPKRTDENPSVETNSNGGGLEDAEFTPKILSYGKKMLDKPDLSPKQETDLGSSKKPTALEEVMHPRPPRDTMPLSTPITTTKPSAKRKYGDENENPKAEKLRVGKENGPLQNRRVIKDISSSRRDKAGNLKTGPLSARPPLAAKSTNDDVSSPRKVSKEPVRDDVKLVKSQQTRQSTQRETQNAHEPMAIIEPVQPEPVSEVAIVSEPDVPSSPGAASLDTPVRSAQRNAPHDTPPPLDIDSNGETIRPSRRARPAVSYAEPSLRVKMRRPTKELFDAVSGEGKFIQRSGTQVPGGSTSAPTSATRPKTESDRAEGSSSKNPPPPKAQVFMRQSAMSPLAQKQLSPVTLPDTVTSDRGMQPSDAVSNPAIGTVAQVAEDQSLPEPGIDIYDFAPASPSIGEVEELNKTSGKGRNSRRSSAAVLSSSRKTASATAADDEYVPESSTVTTSSAPSKSRSSHPRKRASMQAPKKTPMAELLSPEEAEAGEGDVSIESVSSTSSGPGSKISAKDKVTRRRSMML